MVAGKQAAKNAAFHAMALARAGGQCRHPPKRMQQDRHHGRSRKHRRPASGRRPRRRAGCVAHAAGAAEPRRAQPTPEDRRRGGGRAGDRAGGRFPAVEPRARIRGAVLQPRRARRRPDHRRARPAERALPHVGQWHGDPGATGPGARDPAAPGGRRPAQGQPRRLRAHGRAEAGHLAVQRAGELPARARRRAHPHGAGDRRGLQRPGAPGDAQAEPSCATTSAPPPR